MRISFDFDLTLSQPYIQSICEALIKNKHEIFIVTSRRTIDKTTGMPFMNSDIFFVANQLGIKEENIYFTEHEPKIDRLTELRINLHFDDDPEEIERLKETSIETLKVSY